MFQKVGTFSVKLEAQGSWTVLAFLICISPDYMAVYI